MSSIARLTVNVKVKETQQPQNDNTLDEQAIVEQCVEQVMETLASLQAR